MFVYDSCANSNFEFVVKEVFIFCAQDGGNAASLNVAEQYVAAFGHLAKTGNTILLPTNTGDISSMVGQVRQRKAQKQKYTCYITLAANCKRLETLAE